MKKILLFSSLALFAVTAFGQREWSAGVYSGMIGNKSVYSGGMTDASALFMHNPHGSVDFGVTARYFHTNHWSLETGFNHTRLGFDFALAKDYSLLTPKNHFIALNSSYGVSQVPVTLIYAFNPNCRNYRFFVGAGINLMAHAGSINKHTDAVSTEKAPIPLGDALSQDMQVNSFVTCAGQLTWGVEHLQKRGGILQLAFVGNLGLSNQATATVDYTVNNQNYEHTFTNNGKYFGMMLNYYFRPFHKKAAK
jgi:hypothetical protein